MAQTWRATEPRYPPHGISYPVQIARSHTVRGAGATFGDSSVTAVPPRPVPPRGWSRRGSRWPRGGVGSWAEVAGTAAFPGLAGLVKLADLGLGPPVLSEIFMQTWSTCCIHFPHSPAPPGLPPCFTKRAVPGSHGPLSPTPLTLGLQFLLGRCLGPEVMRPSPSPVSESWIWESRGLVVLIGRGPLAVWGAGALVTDSPRLPALCLPPQGAPLPVVTFAV